MPRRDLEKNLHSRLVDSEFSFIPRGIHTTKDIYLLVKINFLEFCDDDFKCRDCCRSGGSDPEWHHIVRSNLGLMTRVIRKANGRGNWEFY
jgi:hypothetical protein